MARPLEEKKVLINSSEEGDREGPLSTRRSKSSQVLDFANVFKSFIGANFMAQPFAFAHAGITGGLIGISVVAAIAAHCCFLLLEVKEIVRRTSQKRITEYGELGLEVFGILGSGFVNFFLVFTQFGFCVGYMVFMGDNIYALTKHEAPQYTLYVILVLYLAPVAYLKRVSQLGMFSMIANVLLIIGMVCLLKTDTLERSAEATIGFRWSTFPIFFSMATSAFEGAGVVLPVEDSMRDQPGRYKIYFLVTIPLVAILLSLFGILGYLTFGNDVAGVITDSVPPGAFATALRILLSVAILFTYPLQLVPVFQVTEGLMFSSATIANDSYFNWKVDLWRTFLVAATAAIAYAVPFFGLIAALVGALGSSFLAFILPAAFHIKVLRDQRMGSKWILGKDVAILLFGFAAALIGTFFAMRDIVGSFEKKKS